MANDADWLADVRRWYFSSRQAAAAPPPEDDDAPEIGYEAAHPALQSPHWPDAPQANVTDPE